MRAINLLLGFMLAASAWGPLGPLRPVPVPLTPKQRWAYVVMGESGGGWPEGSLLVAWTLRAWELNKGMPARLAGPRWGWYAWRVPGFEARAAVDAAWGQPLSAAPFDFMQAGHYCDHLGSAADVRYWQSIGMLGEPDYVLTFPGAPQYSMNCYFELAPSQWITLPVAGGACVVGVEC